MNLVNYISAFLIPLTLFIIVLYGLLQKKPVFELFLKGAKSGILTVWELAPTVIGLFIAIGVLRSSGALQLLCTLFEPLASLLHLPAEILPLSILKLFSASGANSLLFDLFKTYGTDSYIGMTASILLSCTETLFYTVSVYCTAAGIRKTRWIIPAGLFLSVLSLFLSAALASALT